MMADSIEPEFIEKMNVLAEKLDQIFNGAAKGFDRRVGFTLLAFNFGDKTRVNYISNADRQDMIITLKALVARFEGQSGVTGRG